MYIEVVEKIGSDDFLGGKRGCMYERTLTDKV